MNIQKLILGLWMVLAGQIAVADESDQNSLPQGDPGMQARAARVFAAVDAQVSVRDEDQINHGCNQNVGTINVAQGHNLNLQKQTIIVKGNIINLCK